MSKFIVTPSIDANVYIIMIVDAGADTAINGGVEFSGIFAKERAEHYVQLMNNPCLAKLKPNEPFFVLRGQDMLADAFVDRWADAALTQGCPVKKVNEAKTKASLMRAWPNRKYPD